MQISQPNTKTEFSVAEYNALRQEMLQHMQSEIQITSFALIFTTSALGLFAASSRPLTPESLLLPLPVLWLGIYSVLEHHQQVITIGTYISQLFESGDSGILWEHHLGDFRKKIGDKVGTSFRFHDIVWSLYTALAVLCVASSLIQANSISPWIVLAGLAVLSIAVHTLVRVRRLEDGQGLFVKVWQEVVENNQGASSDNAVEKSQTSKNPQ